MWEGLFGGGSGGGWLGKLATALLGSVATAFVAQGANALFAPKPPGRREMQQDIGMQRQAAEPIRTPEQTETDRMTVEAGRQRAATFADLSKEYAGLQARGPVYDPFTEEKVKQEAMADAAVRGMGESGQAQELVKRRLQEYRLGRSTVHGQELGALRTQMQPYSQVQAPSSPPIFTPQIAPQPRTVQPFMTPAPVDILSAMRTDPEKKKPGKALNQQPDFDADRRPYFGIDQ